MAFKLTTIPGFADLPDHVLEAEQPALGMLISRISGNASFGMVRPEIFVGLYKDGETVNLPVSTVDGYTYQRSELMYAWGIYSTVNAGTGWISGPGALWYAAWKVDQTTGAVSCVEFYRKSEGKQQDNSSASQDGVLQVFTIAQRQRSTLTVGSVPNYIDINGATDFAIDKALHTTPLTQLNHNAKYGVLSSEVIYMGEFYNGQTVPKAISPADGYTYSYGEMKMIHSWRWTTVGTAFTQPDYSQGQLHRIEASISPTTGIVTTAVTMFNSGTISTTNGRVAVFAFCQRTGATVSEVTVPATAMPWLFTGGINSSYPYGVNNGTAPIVLPDVFSSGDTLAINYLSGTVRMSDSRPPVDAAGQSSYPTLSAGGSTGTGFPGKYLGGSSHLGAGVGAWVVRATGVVIQPEYVGLSASLTCPIGADAFQLGIDDDNFHDNTGKFSFSYSVNGGGPSVSFSDALFEEIDDTLLFPGNPLYASLVQQINKNIKLAVVRQEFFGPTSYSNGSTVSLPTSPIDSYAYTRNELFYIWEWASTGPETGGTITQADIRFWEFDGHVDENGLVSLHESRDPTGGGILNTTDGSLKVITVGIRSSAQGPAYTPDPTFNPRPPGDTTGAGDVVSTSPAVVISQDAADATHLKSASFDATFESGAVASYGARTYGISDPGSTPVTYYVTIHDPTAIGDAAGTLTSYCETTDTKARTAGYVFVGKIIATHTGGYTGSVAGPSGIDQTLVA